MFTVQDLDIRLACNVFSELLIGLSEHCWTPPSDTEAILRHLPLAGTYAETRDATTEMTHGAGIASEFGQGVRYA